MPRPTLSVITPVFNGCRHIESCIRNVIEQKCPVAEHVIVDGGSSDGSTEVIRYLAERHGHIRWLSEPDKGQSDALNKGTALARGDIIGILNIDDLYEPDVLNRILKLVPSLQPPWLLVGACNVWGPGGRLRYVNRPRHLSLFAFLVGLSHPVNPSAYFYHRSVHNHLDGYRVDEHYSMDIHFLYQAVQIAEVRYLDEVWGNFFELPGTKTYSDKNGNATADRLGAINERYRADLSPAQRQLLRILRNPYVLARRSINALRDPGQVYRRYLGKRKDGG